MHQCFCFVIQRKGPRIFLIAEKNKEELVGLKGFYPKRGFKEYIPTRNKSDQIIREYFEECQDGRYLLLLNNVFSTSHEANCFKEMEKVADATQARVYPNGDIFNSIVHLDLCRLMVYMPNYILLSRCDEAKSGE